MRRIMVLILAGCAGMLCATPVLSTVIHVPVDQPTIQAGINAASNHDTVSVAPGTYNGALTVNSKPITLTSDSGAAATRLSTGWPSVWVLLISNVLADTFHLSGFTFSNSYGSAVGANHSLFVVTGCVFDGIVGNYAVGFSHTNSWGIIRGNRFLESCGYKAVYTDNLANLVVERNVFDGSKTLCISAASSRAWVLNNTFVNCNDVISLPSKRGVIVADVYNNIFVGTVGTAIVGDDDGPVHDYNAFYQNGADVLGTGTELHGVFADPRFVDTATDFHLRPLSPCIDAGNPDAQYNDTDGTRNDIGAYPRLCGEPTDDCDGDGIVNGSDNCPLSVNPLQEDQDFDLVGDGCDNCQLVANTPQIDTDDDGIGDACEAFEVSEITIGGAGDVPSHLLNNSPGISWQFTDPSGHAYLGAAIQVGSDSDWTAAEMWDEPFIAAPTQNVDYVGAPLLDGTTYFARIRVLTDSAWSDWRSKEFHMNAVPIPQLFSPINRRMSSQEKLRVSPASDVEGDQLEYAFEVYSDSALTLHVATSPLDYATTWITGAASQENQIYWWRCRAWDGYEFGAWAPAARYWVDDFNTVPASVSLCLPSAGGIIAETQPTFVWNVPIDPDPLEFEVYTVRLAIDSLLVFGTDVTGIEDTTLVWPTTLPGQTHFYWRVTMLDARGGSASSVIRVFYRCDCHCHADPICDGSHDVLDVTSVIISAFRGHSGIYDASCAAYPSSVDGRTDVDCNGMTDLLDVVKMIDVAFRGESATTTFCRPCGP